MGENNKKALGVVVGSFILVISVLALLGFVLWNKSSDKAAKKEDELAIELSMDNEFEFFKEVLQRGEEKPLQMKLMDCAFVQIQHILRTEGKLSSYIFKCLYLTLPEPGFDDGQMTPNTVLEPVGSLRTSSGLSRSGSVAGEVGCRKMDCTATTEITRKKRSNVSSPPSICLGFKIGKGKPK
ncbi:hypothetical protein LOK49_LG12G00413 [Camellia lanceoleosa]|uniref:Uncharacterized protein n=1 Tax=Camellia lanceoleosa TaxID=1840588 RepID=A0ACC0FPW2_9ERIC|nr:hypothetical protein LOK49_LG12G00413 [Camellia lanceoleosa]